MIGAEDEKRGELWQRLNSQTAKIAWSDLQRFYAQGLVIGVQSGHDLVDVACHFAEDDRDFVAGALERGKVYKVEDQQAEQWVNNGAMLWAVVVAPWVLVQQVADAD